MIRCIRISLGMGVVTVSLWMGINTISGIGVLASVLLFVVGVDLAFGEER